jgi:2-dehydro-3-deoxy-D-arabinonate dehydratase
LLPGELRIADLLTVPLHQMRLAVQLAETEIPAEDVRLLSPVDGAMEVWAAGVTYSRSRDARVEESSERTEDLLAGSSIDSVYDRVYQAERPELFFKAPAWRVVTDGEAIAVREDSSVNVPEPELGLVVNSAGEIAGYLVVNDVSSRSIEGENPLYLPQAKVYAGSCAVSAGIVPAWLTEIDDLAIEMVVRRGTEVAFTGSSSTREFHRSPAGLVPYLVDWLEFPEGVVLSTGTGIVPDLDFTLTSGDVVEITIEGIGRLVNPVLGVRDWIGGRRGEENGSNL